MRRQIGRPRFPSAHAFTDRQRIIRKRLERDAEAFSHRLPAPAGDVEGLAGGGEPVGMLMQGVACRRPGRKLVAGIDGRLQTSNQRVKARSEMRLERGDRVSSAEQCLLGVVQQLAQRFRRRQVRPG